MPLLRLPRWRNRSVSARDGSLSGASDIDPDNTDAEKHGKSNQEADPAVAEVASLCGPAVLTESDSTVNPGELTFDEGMSSYCTLGSL